MGDSTFSTSNNSLSDNVFPSNCANTLTSPPLLDLNEVDSDLISSLKMPQHQSMHSIDEEELKEIFANKAESRRSHTSQEVEKSTNLSASFSDSFIDLIFDEKAKAEEAINKDNEKETSSLSLIDLEEMDSGQLINGDISSPIRSPSHSCKGHLLSSASASPIVSDKVVASTPFHGRIVSSCSEGSNAFIASANRTYCIDDPPEVEVKPALNVTYDSKPKAANATFTAVPNPVDALQRNTTFNASFPDAPKAIDNNKTFEVVVNRVSDKGVMASQVVPPGLNTTFNADAETVSSSKDTSEESDKESVRKPLTALNNTGNSRLKPPMTSQVTKRASRLQAPRMNAAAISRIQARSPPQKSSSNEQDENSSTRSALTTSLRKPTSRKSVAVARKSLLPPSGSKQSKSIGTALKKSPLPVPKTSTSQSIPSKRKAESPKHPSRVSKSEAPLPRSSGSTASLLRHSIHGSSRVSSIAPRQSTKSQKLVSNSSSSISRSDSAVGGTVKSRGLQSKLKSATKQSQSSPPVKKLKAENSYNDNCVVAMATLLDYVVNQLDGLSAPKLSSDKKQLKQLINTQQASNANLSSRLDGLEQALESSRDSHERDVADAEKKHEQEINDLRKQNEIEQTNLRERIQEISDQLSKQETDHKNAIDSLIEENRKTVADLDFQHGETVAQLRLEWSEEREEIERETEELRQNMNDIIDAKVEELIQPYINSYEENKSLRSVLEMKNQEQHKLKLELSKQANDIKDISSLRSQLEVVQQKNEDLQTQVQEKNNEQRQLRKEIVQLRRNLEEQQHTSTNQQQKIDELHYRLSSASPTPPSPFNPVFTTSPPTNQPFGEGRTSLRQKHLSSQTLGSPNGDSVSSTLRENGRS